MDRKYGTKKGENMERMVRIILIIEEKLPKGGENKDNAHVELPFINKHILGGFYSIRGDKHGWFPKVIHIPKIYMRKFDGNDPITWIF